jgi:hypothetical protein
MTDDQRKGQITRRIDFAARGEFGRTEHLDVELVAWPNPIVGQAGRAEGGIRRRQDDTRRPTCCRGSSPGRPSNPRQPASQPRRTPLKQRVTSFSPKRGDQLRPASSHARRATRRTFHYGRQHIDQRHMRLAEIKQRDASLRERPYPCEVTIRRNRMTYRVTGWHRRLRALYFTEGPARTESFLRTQEPRRVSCHQQMVFLPYFAARCGAGRSDDPAQFVADVESRTITNAYASTFRINNRAGRLSEYRCRGVRGRPLGRCVRLLRRLRTAAPDKP